MSAKKLENLMRSIKAKKEEKERILEMRRYPNFANWVPKTKSDFRLINDFTFPIYAKKTKAKYTAPSMQSADGKTTKKQKKHTTWADEASVLEKRPTNVDLYKKDENDMAYPALEGGDSEPRTQKKAHAECATQASLPNNLAIVLTTKLKSIATSQLRPEHLRKQLPKYFCTNIKNAPKHFTINCPLSHCEKHVAYTSLVSHIVLDHATPVYQLAPQNRLIRFSIDLHNIRYNMPICFGLFVYSDMQKKPFVNPNCLRVRDGSLPARDGVFCPDYVVLVMAQMTTWPQVLNVNVEDPLSEPHINDILCVWFTFSDSLNALYANCKTEDRYGLFFIRSMLKMRDLELNQDPNTFLRTDSACMRLTNSDIEILSENGRKPIDFQFKIREVAES